MMNNESELISPAEKIALWADRLRDLSATGLKYANNAYDVHRYEIIQAMVIEMLAYAMAQPQENFLPLKGTLFSRISPFVAGCAAVIDQNGKLLLMRRTDNHLWAMPGGQMEVGETPAEAVVRETLEETGIQCIPKALSGIYDSRFWNKEGIQQIYKFTFWCEPVVGQTPVPYDPVETLEIGWFDEENLPVDLYQGHFKRISDAYEIRKGNLGAYFDFRKKA
jgi:8-oxo-dGTP pyrophosphatase MutT (NUDIX family)